MPSLARLASCSTKTEDGRGNGRLDGQVLDFLDVGACWNPFCQYSQMLAVLETAVLEAFISSILVPSELSRGFP